MSFVQYIVTLFFFYDAEFQYFASNFIYEIIKSYRKFNILSKAKIINILLQLSRAYCQKSQIFLSEDMSNINKS